MNFLLIILKSGNILSTHPAQRARYKILQQRSYRLAVQNNENDMQDFDAISELSSEAYAEIFERGAEISFQHIFAL